jgi:hypothetical protein
MATASKQEAEICLRQLRLAVRSRALDPHELAEQTAIYVGALMKYQPDAVRQGCALAARSLEYFPTLKELLKLVGDHQPAKILPSFSENLTWKEQVDVAMNDALGNVAGIFLRELDRIPPEQKRDCLIALGKAWEPIMREMNKQRTWLERRTFCESFLERFLGKTFADLHSEELARVDAAHAAVRAKRRAAGQDEPVSTFRPATEPREPAHA